ncbi:zinc-regulated TonB-dependent outer membrane receptor [Verrucomicrobia bacterium S94]|nr:zinc-regulated TonB-dependent outer membrane receptor [Verrucomicrobia bacterium S94]
MNYLNSSAMFVAGTLLICNASAQDAAVSSGITFNDSTGALRAFNPAVSATIDMFYYNENSDEGLSHMKEEVAGFGGHSHDEDEHDHDHGYENGFNLRHLELTFYAEVDNYFRAQAIAAISEEGAEMEEAWAETTGLPWGLQAKAGKFFSNFGYINAQHSHQWDFTDQPLIYELTLGSHGLNDKGVQVSWLAPTPFYLLFGAEVFQGDNENMYVQEEADELPENDGPRLGVGWVKIAPFQFDNSELQFGLFGASGSHQEIHEEEVGGIDYDYFYDGDNMFFGGDVVYKYSSGKAYGQGDAVVQAEYFYRDKDLDLKDSDAPGAPIGSALTGAQDGYYIQGTYGFLPRWRAGLRWDQVGLTNEEQEPGEAKEEFGDSWRASAMVDFRPSEFSQIRFQVNNGDYDLGDEGTENVWEAFVQLTFSLGAHGAHSF